MKKESENQVFHEFLGSLEDVTQKGLNEKISFFTFILTSYRSIMVISFIFDYPILINFTFPSRWRIYWALTKGLTLETSAKLCTLANLPHRLTW